MMPNFIKHKVRPQDSLASLASRMRMTEDELKEFHNHNCGKMDKLWFTNLRGVEFVLIPTLFISKEEQEIRKSKMLPSKEYSQGFHASKYLVSEKFEEPHKKDSDFNYSANLNIQNSKHGFAAETSLADFRKNGIASDDKVSSLSLACMNSIYPIPYNISQKGKLGSLLDHKNLIEKFRNKRADLEDFFIGDISKSYIDWFVEKLTDENYFFRQIQSSLLYQTLFPNLEWFHKKTGWKEAFYIYKNSFPVEFNFQTELTFDDPDLVETKITGTNSENCSLRELLKGIRIEDENAKDYIDAEIQIQYFTHKITKQLYEIKSSVEIRHQNEVFQKHHLHITQN
ncbi:hypothetical protein [Chryseobacterium sp. CBo1]|uniref:hypothetical protein n=1 Tax=Chryseobacterium sp. CBo1 TaxID=1869230 RepID=UPI000A4B8FB9|nr:hypothetical protein [Chryseobacterium sp. CBo1]